MNQSQIQQTSPWKKPLLYSLIVSVLIGATLGIAIVLRGQWDWYEVRALLTTVIIGLASLCGLAADLSKSVSSVNTLPRISQALTIVAAVLLLGITWVELGGELVWKTAACTSIFAVASVHICLLSLASLPGKFKWVFAIAWQSILGLATLLSWTILGDGYSEGMIPVITVNSIWVAALSLIIPILHRISRLDASSALALMPIDERNVQTIDREIAKLRKRITSLEKARREIASDGYNASGLGELT